MSVWLDIIGSFVIGTLLALNVMRMNADITAVSYKSSLAYTAHINALTAAEILDEDLQKMGYGVTGTAITLADSLQIRFLSDLDADGTVDTLFYSVGNTTEASSTLNPDDRILYRALNSATPQPYPMGITEFHLSYFGAAGDSLALPPTLGDIRQVRVNLWVESTVPYDTTYAKAFMQLRVVPKNM